MVVFDNKLEQLGETLKKARIEKGYTTRALATLSKVASNAEISMLENAKRGKPDPIILKTLAKILDLDYIELFQLIGYIDESVPECLKKMTVPLDQEIKVYNSISVDKGEIVFNTYIKSIYVPYCGKNCVGFVVAGDSMEPRIPNNSIVVIDRDIKELEHKNVAVFLINGESHIKRVLKQNGIEYLVSDSQNYDPIFIDKNNDVKIVGKVIRLIVEDFI